VSVSYEILDLMNRFMNLRVLKKADNFFSDYEIEENKLGA